ncbi:MAG TPA: DUF4386 family protein [Candidatus Angelobacter sp.]|nr:DUF4386 family protein [Candidatus Angelobacter sp.]
MDEQKNVLRWGGLAGMLGGLFFILTIIVLLVLVPPSSSDPAGLVKDFPTVRLGVTLGDSLDFVAVILWVGLFIGLYQALHGTNRPPALFGSILGVLGQVVLAAGALPPVAFAPISDLYHAAGATPQDQATLLLMAQATQGMFNETDTIGFILMTVGFILLGLAMLKTPAFGRVFGGVSVVLGLAGIVGISVFAVNSSSFAIFGILMFIVLPILLGWKIYSLSKRM